MTLYSCPETRSMRSLWLLNELGVPFELVDMPFDHKYLRSKEYLAVHPLGRIPALKDEDLTMFESGAICEYLCEKYNSPLYRAPGHPERAHWLQWIHYAETLLVHGQNLVQQYVFVSEAERSPVVTGDVPMGVSSADAGGHIRLLMLVNDVSLRNLIPGELAKGFGFFQSKTWTAFSPVAVTPDELGNAWNGGSIDLPLRTDLNQTNFGHPNARTGMVFDFPQLIAHAAKTRPLAAGTIIGSGTVANEDRSVGSSCIAERRAIETIDSGAPRTQFMKFGDRVRIEMLDRAGASIFGAIDQVVEQA
jgi:2-keto-4-pentenoate hydratase/2-oxohepta-3-ene-1,7-dioic acid hydratase in catechol pathway